VQLVETCSSSTSGPTSHLFKRPLLVCHRTLTPRVLRARGKWCCVVLRWSGVWGRMSDSSTIFTVEELTTATNNFERLVGAGGCGEVFEGVLGSGQHVAVKRWRGGASQQGLAELMNEVTILSRLAHPHILPVLGFACQPPDLMLVTPYMARGSLFDALHGGAGGASGEGAGAAWRLAFVAGIARGIRALREAQIVHRDIKSANVLISDSPDADGQQLPIAMLADAGVARRMRIDAAQAHAATATRVIGTDGYLDPEYQDTEAGAYTRPLFSST